MNRDNLIHFTLLCLRGAVAVIFICAGAMKIFGWFGGMPPNGDTAPILSQVGIGGVLEFFGGLLILAGFLTRPVAFILSGEMAVAYFQFHFPKGFLPIQNHGEAAVLCCFIFLFLAAQGAGKLSVDHIIWGRSKSPNV